MQKKRPIPNTAHRRQQAGKPARASSSIIAGMAPRSLFSLIRRLLRWTLWGLAAVVLVVVLGLGYVTFVGVPVDASLLRGRIAGAFSEALGREVRFEGPMELEISARPRLRVGGLHIANAPGFEGGDFASLGEARLALDLWPLLQRRLQIEEISGSKVSIRLQHRADGSNNWTFVLPQRQAPPPPPAADGQAPMISTGEALTMLDVRQVTLENLNVEYVGASGKSHYFDLHRLSAQSRSGEPLKLTLDGAVEKEFPYQVAFTGGLPADLADPDKPWPVDLTLTFLSSTLTASGTVSGRNGEIRFGLGTENLHEFERLLQTRLPPVGASGIAGLVRYEPGKVSLTQLGAAMGNTALIGNLEFDYSGVRPRVSGELAVPVLDMRPFLTDRPREEIVVASAPPKSLAEVYRELSAATFSLAEMTRADADVKLRVDNWLSLPGEVRDVALQVKVQDGRLEAPMQATVTGVTLAGSALVDGVADPPTFRLALGTRDSELGGLAELLTGARGIAGKLGRFDLRIAAQGDQGAELVQSLDVRLDVERGAFSYGNVEGGRPVEFTLEKFAVAIPAGKALTGELRGSLLGNPLTAQLRGGALETMMLETRAPLDFSVRSGTVRARLHGMIQPPAADRGPELAFEVSAANAGDVADWFGLRAGARAPVALSGRASMRSTEWRLADVAFRLGRSQLNADLARVGIGSQPLVQVSLRAAALDVAELESLLPKAEKKEASGGPVLDIPILPQGIDLTDADIAVRLARLLNSPLEVREVSFDGRVREGYMHPSPFAATVADTALSGAILLDLRGTDPNAGLWLYANQVNIGELLRRLGLARDIDSSIDLIQLYLATRSTRLGDLIANADLTGNLVGGRLALRDPGGGPGARIALESGLLRAAPGDKVALQLDGALDDIPVRIGIETASARDLVDPKLRVPFRLTLDAAESRVALSGAIARPLGDRDVELALDASGPRFSTLDKLVRASLPPWGPWSAAGRFRMSKQGYAVDDLKLQVGESVLTGTGQYGTAGPRPRIDIALSAPNIQLDDFRLAGWTPVEKKPEPEKELTAEEIRKQAAAASDKAQTLLSPAVLRRQDVFLDIRVEQVRSGADQLGSGRLLARLENGRADIGPIEINIPGGSAKLAMGYEPSETDVAVDLKIDVEKFDYGILARRIKPETDLSGSFSVKMDVRSRARYLSDILKHGSGRIEFGVWPVNMQSGIFDLWAVNVLVALVPAVDPGKASKVNCAIGRFDLHDGKLSDRIIVLDTGRMRVVGKGSADFDAESLDLRMRPQAKSAQFLSLATPIRVSGTFSNFKIGVAPGGMIETVGRLATSIVWVPLQKLFGKKIPADGADVCQVALDDALR